jgi:hypothetical protein
MTILLRENTKFCIFVCSAFNILREVEFHYIAFINFCPFLSVFSLELYTFSSVNSI